MLKNSKKIKSDFEKLPLFLGVLKGSIAVQANRGNDLCWFSSKVDFNHLKGDKEAQLTFLKAPGNTCKDKSEYKCHKNCNNYCYGPDALDCQERKRFFFINSFTFTLVSF